MFVIHKRESAVDSTLLILFLGTNYSDYFNIDIKIFQERARAKKKAAKKVLGVSIRPCLKRLVITRHIERQPLSSYTG